MSQFSIQFGGLRVSKPVKDLDTFNGFYDPHNAFLPNAYHQSLVKGKIASLDTNGFIKLCDGATENPIGFIMRDFINFDLGSNSTPSDGGLTVFFGQGIISTDQIVTTETFVPGDKLYCGTGANIGKVTKTSPAVGAKVIGIADNAASASAPLLTINIL